MDLESQVEEPEDWDLFLDAEDIVGQAIPEAASARSQEVVEAPLEAEHALVVLDHPHGCQEFGPNVVNLRIDCHRYIPSGYLDRIFLLVRLCHRLVVAYERLPGRPRKPVL